MQAEIPKEINRRASISPSPCYNLMSPKNPSSLPTYGSHVDHPLDGQYRGLSGTTGSDYHGESSGSGVACAAWTKDSKIRRIMRNRL